MHHPQRDVRPRELDFGGLVLAGLDDGQRQRDGVELRRLLQQVVVVVCDPAHGRGRLLFDLRPRQRVVAGDVEAREDREARCVHPDLHGEGPAVEGDDGCEEARELEGGHGCGWSGRVKEGGSGSVLEKIEDVGSGRGEELCLESCFIAI